jgi:phosphomevalonate kinase
MLIIGLSGKVGSGKDFIARHVIHRYIKQYCPDLKVNVFGFEDPLKLEVMKHYNVDFEQAYPPEGVPRTDQVRFYMYYEGQVTRERDPDHWIKHYRHWSHLFELNGYDILIAPDVRYMNEVEHIRACSGLVCKVNAPNREYKTDNKRLLADISECELDTFQDFDYVFDNQMDLPANNFSKIQNQYSEFFDMLVELLESIYANKRVDARIDN